jgi:uncharacterized protein YggL (DUF469 family)
MIAVCSHDRLEETVMIRRMLIAMGAMVCAGVVVVQAHENRPVGGYTVTVGFRAEPAVEDVVNAVDILINRSSYRKAISVRDGDIVDLTVQVQLREDDAPDAKIWTKAWLKEQPRQDFAASNRYNAWFKPTHDGAYAFRIKGTISDAGDPQVGPQVIDETYVCGNGTQSSTSRFNCVEDPQTFPGKPSAGYRNNNLFSHD